MHILHSPVFLATNSTGAPHGDELSRINPRFNKSSTCLACSRSCCAESGYAFRFTGFSLPVSITWSISRLGGTRVGNRPGRVGQSLLADPIPIFSGSGHLMPDPVPTLVGIISGSTRSRTHLGEVLADPDRDLDRVAEFNPRYLT